MPRRPQDWSPKTRYIVATRLEDTTQWLRDIETRPPTVFWTPIKREAGIFKNVREAELWAKRVATMVSRKTWVEEA